MPRVILHFLIAVLVAAVAAACGSSKPPTGPTPPTPPPANNAPVITGITVSLTRVEVGVDVTIAATVTDAETNVDQLTYVWTASVGTITGTGRTVTWRLAAGAATTPADVVVRLTVTEPYQALEGGAIVTKTHTVEATAPSFRVHDSDAELRAMTLDFLRKFADSSVSPEVAVNQFTDSCVGKRDELQDIIDNRKHFVVLGSEYRVASVTLNGDRTFADIVAPCYFRSRCTAAGAAAGKCAFDGKIDEVQGDCLLTAVYEQPRWWLCSSRFSGVLLPSMSGFFGEDRGR